MQHDITRRCKGGSNVVSLYQMPPSSLVWLPNDASHAMASHTSIARFVRPAAMLLQCWGEMAAVPPAKFNSSIQIAHLKITYTQAKARRSDIRMMLWQTTPPKFECLLFHRNFFFVPPEFTIRVAKIMQRVALEQRTLKHGSRIKQEKHVMHSKHHPAVPISG